MAWHEGVARKIVRALGCDEDAVQKIIPIIRSAMERWQWLTVKEFARRHGISPAQVKRRCDRQLFPPGMVQDWGMGSQHYYLIRSDALDHMAAEQRSSPAPPASPMVSRRSPARPPGYTPQILTY
jgi:hypothetical protein